MPLDTDNRIKSGDTTPLKAILLSEGECRLIADELTRDAAIVAEPAALSTLGKFRNVWGWAS